MRTAFVMIWLGIGLLLPVMASAEDMAQDSEFQDGARFIVCIMAGPNVEENCQAQAERAGYTRHYAEIDRLQCDDGLHEVACYGTGRRRE